MAYLSGNGVTKNSSEAFFWFLLAANDGDEVYTDAANEAALDLSADERQEIRVRVSRWKPE